MLNTTEMDCLNDEQIEELLQQAEQRAIKSGASNKAALIPRPAATTTTLPAPYMKTDGHVASVDAHRFLKTDDKQSTGNVRKLDDPVAARQQKIEASITSFIPYPLHYMRKTNPYLNVLTWIMGAVLVPSSM